jgi:hypothetical protein
MSTLQCAQHPLGCWTTFPHSVVFCFGRDSAPDPPCGNEKHAPACTCAFKFSYSLKLWPFTPDKSKSWPRARCELKVYNFLAKLKCIESWRIHLVWNCNRSSFDQWFLQTSHIYWISRSYEREAECTFFSNPFKTNFNLGKRCIGESIIHTLPEICPYAGIFPTKNETWTFRFPFIAHWVWIHGWSLKEPLIVPTSAAVS